MFGVAAPPTGAFQLVWLRHGRSVDAVFAGVPRPLKAPSLPLRLAIRLPTLTPRRILEIGSLTRPGRCVATQGRTFRRPRPSATRLTFDAGRGYSVLD